MDYTFREQELLARSPRVGSGCFHWFLPQDNEFQIAHRFRNQPDQASTQSLAVLFVLIRSRHALLTRLLGSKYNVIAWGIGCSSPSKPPITVLFHFLSQEVSDFEPISLQCIRPLISALLPSCGGVNFITHPRRRFNFFSTSGPRDLLKPQHNYCHLSFPFIVYDYHAEHTPHTCYQSPTSMNSCHSG